MAKRDKLYTVNKWNRPFFEEERRRKLYLGGGPFDINNGYTNGVKTNQGSLINSFGITSWGNPLADANQKTREGITDFAAYSNPGHMMDQFHQYNRYPTGTTQTIQPIQQETQKQDNEDKPKSDWLTRLPDTFNRLNAAYNTYNAIESTKKALNNGSIDLSKLTTAITPAKLPDITISSGRTIAGNNLINHLSLNTDALTSQATKDAVKSASKKLVESLPQTGSTGTKFFDTSLGQGLAMTGANIAGDALRGLVRNKELGNTTAARVGDALSTIGSAVGTGLMATGYGLPIGLLATGIGKTLGMIADQFGSVKHDNGTSNYIYTLQGSNPQGSNEYLANLQATTPYGPEATYTDGIFTDSGKYWARRQNRAVAKAYEDYQRKIKQALYNNNWMQMQHAINESAMGGRINRKKCNCKADGGILNTAISPTSAAGYDILSTYLTTQMQKNQNNQDMGSSVGNSFMATPDTGTLFASGGPINIKKSHRGRLTELKKRTGKTEAELYNDGNPAHRKMVTFARNARKWKKAYGGFLDAANNLSEIEKTLYGNGGTLETKDKDYRNNSFFNGASLYDLGGVLQAAGVNWGKATEINEGGTHEENPYEGVQVGVDPEGTPNLVEEGEVIWNDYVFSDRIECPKEVCKLLRVGVKKNGFTFAEVAKKLLKESKERPNDPISKRGLEANMQKLEDYQEEVKQKMEAEQAVEQFNSLPPEQQVAIMNQEGQKAQDAVAQQQMAQELQNLPPEQQQAIAKQMAIEQAQTQGVPQGMPQQDPSPEEQAMMQQQMAQQQYAPQGGINPQEALAQAAAMQQQAINGSAYGGRLFAEGGMIPQDQPTEQPTEQADPEMAKYSDEELQEIINDYEEAANGEKKVTKGRLARLKKKAERAERELERRNSQGENAEQEQPGAAEGQPQEPTQEQIQAAAQAQAQQQMIEGQQQGGMPQEGMSPEQAMMMQQQMGQQMSPEEMAAAELQQQTGQQYAYGGKVNKYAYAGPLKPQPIGPGIAREVQEPYKRHPDIPQEVYDWFLSLTPEERFDLFGGSPVFEQSPKIWSTDPNSWYMVQKQNTGKPNRKGWSTIVQDGPNSDSNDSSRKAVLEAYNRRDKNGKYVPHNISPDVIFWYMNLPKKEQQAIVANTKMKNKDASTIVRYANTGAPKEVANAIIEAYNTANGQTPVSAQTSDATSTVANTLTNAPVINNTQQTAPIQSVDYIPYFRGMQVNDILGQIWDQMSTEKRNGVLRNDFITNTSKMPTINWSDYNDELLNIYYGLHPEAKNSGWTFSNNPYRTYANVNFHDATSTQGDNGNKMVPENFYANDPAWLELTDEQRKLTGNELAKALEGTKAYQDFSKYLRDNRNSQYVQDYFAELVKRGSIAAKRYNPNMSESDFNALIEDLREDASKPPADATNKNNNALGLGHFTPAFEENWTNRYWVKDANGNYNQVIGGITDEDKDKYIAINANNPYKVTVGNNNYNDYYYKLKSDTDNGTNGPTDESKYLTVGWKPKTNYTDYLFGALPGLTGLGMMLGQGQPDTSGLEAIANSYSSGLNTMAPIHLTHGQIKPAIIDPRVTYNTANAQRLGTNRMLRNTGSAPSQAATILANDANYQNQMGEMFLKDWLTNRQQEQAAADFNRNTATTNAQFLNAGDQFNAKMLADAADKSASLRYQAAKEKLDQKNAYRAGLLGNLGSIFTGLNEARKQQNINNQRDLLLASGVFGETNPFLENYYGISKVDPDTGKVVRGYNTGWYYRINPQTSKPEYSKTPFLATPTIQAACGGKLKKNKRRGYTY